MSMADPMRLKLDRRIHNQRVALRENWMIVEQRQRMHRSVALHALRKLDALADLAGIPDKPDGVANKSIWWRVQQLEAMIRTSCAGECICPKCGLRHGGSSASDHGF